MKKEIEVEKIMTAEEAALEDLKLAEKADAFLNMNISADIPWWEKEESEFLEEEENVSLTLEGNEVVGVLQENEDSEETSKEETVKVVDESFNYLQSQMIKEILKKHVEEANAYFYKEVSPKVDIVYSMLFMKEESLADAEYRSFKKHFRDEMFKISELISNPILKMEDLPEHIQHYVKNKITDYLRETLSLVE